MVGVPVRLQACVTTGSAIRLRWKRRAAERYNHARRVRQAPGREIRRLCIGTDAWAPTTRRGDQGGFMDYAAVPNLPTMFFDQARRPGDRPFLWVKRDGRFEPP